MGIKMVAFNIPKEIEEGLLKGIYEREGGIVRKTIDKKVVQWLEEVPIERDESLKNVLQMLKDNKFGAGIFVAFGLAIIGGTIYVKNKKEKDEKIILNKIHEFTRTFIKYLEKVQVGELTVEIINDVQCNLSDINQILMDNDIEFAKEIIEQWNILIKTIFDFTKELAEINNHSALELPSQDRDIKSNLIKLEDYLDIQKDIFMNDEDESIKVKSS